jgi:hypothetical protein
MLNELSIYGTWIERWSRRGRLTLRPRANNFKGLNLDDLIGVSTAAPTPAGWSTDWWCRGEVCYRGQERQNNCKLSGRVFLKVSVENEQILAMSSELCDRMWWSPSSFSPFEDFPSERLPPGEPVNGKKLCILIHHRFDNIVLGECGIVVDSLPTDRTACILRLGNNRITFCFFVWNTTEGTHISLYPIT